MKTLLLAMTVLAVMRMAITPVTAAHLEKATFAGGCFWCMEHPFDQIPGVISVTPGYTGGHTKNPTYEEVSAGRTGHAESVQIVYDPQKVTYQKLLSVFWHNIDPTARDRPVMRGISTGVPSFITMRNSTVWRCSRRNSWRSTNPSKGLSSPRLCRPPSFILPKSTTSIITKRTLSATGFTVTDAVATSGSRNCGAMRRDTDEGRSG
jgi:hypothetical protein